MGYTDETYAKISIMSSCRMLAARLNMQIAFDDPERLAYGDLVALRDDLLAKYNEETFVQQGLKEAGLL